MRIFSIPIFGLLPKLGKGLKLIKYRQVIEKLEFVEKQFNKPMVSFDANIHALYDCLQGPVVELDEDFDWFMTLGITTYTETSGLASEFISRVLNNEFFKYDEYFKELNVSSRETEFLAWYSNIEATQGFLDQFMYLLQLYCIENPKDEELGDVYREDNRRELNKSTIAFFNSQHFRLMLDDFITMVKLSIHSQVRRINGEAN